jgi:teichuronic acid biosynthesis glycosyltransferase TuaC
VGPGANGPEHAGTPRPLGNETCTIDPTPKASASQADCAMRVLLVTNLYPTANEPTRGIFVRRQFDALQRTSSVEVITVVVGKTGVGGVRASRKAVSTALQTQRPDIVHVYYGLSGAALPMMTPVPIVLTLCGSDLLWALHSWNLRALLERSVSLVTASRAARILVQSPLMKAALPLRRLRRRVAILPTGIDLQLFRPLPRAECRRVLNWDPSDAVVLFPANPARSVKRYALALAAVQELAALLQRSVQLQALESVQPRDVPLYLNAADCIVITSRWEAGPIVLTEALACGTPVVTVPVGYASDRTWRTGYVRVAPSTPAALASALADVFRNPVPHRRPTDVTIPDALGYASRLHAIYDQVLDGA